MCVGDWRLGRLIRHNITGPITVGPTPTQIASSQQRVAISFGIDASSITLTNNVLLQVGGITICELNNYFPLRHLTLAEHGDLPMQAWTIAQGAGGPGVTYIEYFLPESVLSAAIEQFNAEYNL